MEVTEGMRFGRPSKLAIICYVKRHGKTLMLLRNKKAGDFHQGKWTGLGGKLESDEMPEECLRREVQEESGLVVTAARLCGFISLSMFDGRDDWFAFVYTADGVIGEIRQSPEGELHWIADEDVLGLNLWPSDRIFIPWLDQAKLFFGRFFYELGELKGYEVAFYQSKANLSTLV